VPGSTKYQGRPLCLKARPRPGRVLQFGLFLGAGMKWFPHKIRQRTRRRCLEACMMPHNYTFNRSRGRMCLGATRACQGLKVQRNQRIARRADADSCQRRRALAPSATADPGSDTGDGWSVDWVSPSLPWVMSEGGFEFWIVLRKKTTAC
jgi:hypothetical protein